MSIKQFIQKDNINMLWEVISDEEIFKFLTREIQSSVYQLFLNNIQGFFEAEKTKTTSLVEINKKYILLILNHIRKNYPIQPNKIKIYQDPVKESITYEEIQNDRRSRFDHDLNKRQEEFEDFMTVKAPPVPEFADKDRDQPIKEMDKILKEMQAQRNYEIEEINRNNNINNPNNENPDNWLKSQKTSLKAEKFDQESNDDESQRDNQIYSRFKFLPSLDQNLNEEIKDKKNVSFSNVHQIKTFNIEDEEDDNIFSKLKRVKNKENENNNIKIQMEETNDKIYKNDDDRLDKLEKDIKNINYKIDKILELLNKS
jgi:hypothetical protein